MSFGEKVRALRAAKLMTQAQLAGDRITRNMLCQIERGAANPSLETALYLADRLGVSVGYLLAGEKEDRLYRKEAAIENLHRAFAAGEYAGCLSMLTPFAGEEDAELALLRAECEYGAAREAFAAGRLRAAAAGFDRALAAAEGTLYETAWLRAQTAVYFRYLGTVSITLASNVLEEAEVAAAVATGDDFCEYYAACLALEEGKTDEVEAYLARRTGELYAARVAGLLLLYRGEYAAAARAYEALLARADLPVGTLLFEVFGDMELCCRKNDDYKRAYEFSNSRQGLLERFLEEV